MAYRIVNSSTYEGYATLGTGWQTFKPGQVIVSEYKPENVTVGISYTKIVDTPAVEEVTKRSSIQGMPVTPVNAIPEAKPAYTSSHQFVKRTDARALSEVQNRPSRRKQYFATVGEPGVFNPRSVTVTTEVPTTARSRSGKSVETVVVTPTVGHAAVSDGGAVLDA